VAPADILAIRTRTYAGLTAEQVAALLDFQTGHHVACKLTDGPKAHLKHHSSVVRYVEKHSEAGGQRIGIIGQVGAS
jgi:hypothetical protein